MRRVQTSMDRRRRWHHQGFIILHNQCNDGIGEASCGYQHTKYEMDGWSPVSK